MKNVMIILAVVVSLVMAAPAYGATIAFDNGSGDQLWHNNVNWAGDVLPVAGDTAVVNVGLTALVTSATTATPLSVTIGSGTAGHVIMDGGSMISSGRGGFILGNMINPTTGTAATFTQSGGTVTFPFFTIGSSSTWYRGYGIYEISGGALNAETMGVGRHNAGANTTNATIGRLRVVGSGGTILATAAGGVTVSEVPVAGGETTTGILEFVVGSTGISKINCIKATFNINSVLDMGLVGGYTPAQFQTFDLLQTTTGVITDNGLTLDAGDVGTWSFAIVNANKTLQATYLIPEPATMVLLGLGGLGVLLRRRRK